jgi:hypothetical protein
MPFQPPRSSSVLASVLAAAGLVLTVAGCSGHVTPLGPTPPQPSHLATPIVLQAMHTKPATPAGKCPAGYVMLPVPGNPGPGPCYRKFGAPVTFTSAAVSPGPVASAAGKPASSSAASALLIALPAADRATLTAITTKAYDSRGAIDITIAGKSWALPQVLAPITGGQFEIPLSTKNQALQLQRTLVSSG